MGIFFILVTLNGWIFFKTWDDVLRAGVYFLILYTHAQLHRFMLLPILIRKEKIVAYCVYAVLLLLFFSFLFYLVNVNWIYPNDYKQYPFFMSFGFHLATCAISLIAMIAPFFIFQLYKNQKEQAETRLLFNEMELSRLNAQLNPHFLFNTFNNLYGISLQEPYRVPDLLQQVSTLMRYQLTKHSGNLIPLADELSFIESYISLEEERVGSRCEIRYDYQDHSNGTDYTIPHLLLITFIENAFKHGANTATPSYVHITIQVKQTGIFELQVINSLPPTTIPAQRSFHIGQENARKRLDILYKNNYTLTIGADEHCYTVFLSLPLMRTIHA